ncbi:hypothetical protein BU23DRAFT_551742 [Bimuria novae-zelandiae CBS 107.79]|uniref:N-acetyltransferase domain-containing protein n=1 Tax=Bimuria novae-zelandiae CBS 107.79 TaxID=1447943 RepID=A0A6A5VHY5_9PLEO|nr:hypothetical protein BU23DRAFT_551742 [Bimuria novae-zelandiae CBS 107.79]
MSSLLVRPVEHADVATCAALRTATLGSLVIGRLPPYPGFVEEQIASIRRNLDDRPFVHHLKVIDPANNDEILAYAKWEIYQDGRSDQDALKQPMKEASKSADQHGRLREAARDYFCTNNWRLATRPHLREFMYLSRHDCKTPGPLRL